MSVADEPALRFGAGGTPGSEFLPDELPPEQVADLVGLARLTLNAALWPCTLPADPLPPPLELALAIVTNRIYVAGDGGGSPQVVSESIGAYSYRLAAPDTVDQAALVGGSVADLIRPWKCQPGVYDLSLRGGSVWPSDWWQRDLDNPLKAWDEKHQPPTAAPSGEIPAEYLTETEADARYAALAHLHDERYSQLAHEHAHGWNAEWGFSSNTAAADPGNGKARLNAAVATATELYLSALDAHDTDWSPELNALRAADALRLQDRDDATRWARFTVTGPAVDAGAWLRVPVAWLSDGPTPLVPTNNQALLIYFARAGHP